MAATNHGVELGGNGSNGCYRASWEIRIAPSLTKRLYMIVNGFTYRSDDKGRHWIKTSLRMIANSAKDSRQPADANGPFKFANQKMAVDPANPNVVYVGTTTDGVWRSLDAGATWKRLADIPISLFGPGICRNSIRSKFRYDKSKTNEYNLCSDYGKGVWQSTDAGVSWNKSQMAWDKRPN